MVWFHTFKFKRQQEKDMSDPDVTSSPPPLTGMRRKVLVNFGLFALFFFFYLGAAVVQTPACKSVATLRVLGMPFGLLVSLMIFPVSWLLIGIWFKKAR
jgi:hypothetical protein